jgi:Transposase IS4
VVNFSRSTDKKYCCFDMLASTSYVCFMCTVSTQNYSRVLQAIDDHQSEISDLSDEGDDDDEAPVEPDVSSCESEEQSDNDTVDSDDDKPLSSYAGRKCLASGWKISNFDPVLTDFAGDDDDVEPRLEWSPMNYLKQYIDEDMFGAMSNCTNINSVARTGKSLNTTPAEIQRFFGMSVMMSCVGYHRIRMYWQRSFSLPLIAECMTRDRYFRIRSSLKVVVDTDVSDEMKKTDRLWKVRPLLDRVRSGCLKQTRPPSVSIDEQMIPFSGACTLRQFVPNKPNPVGLKNFVCASQQGLVMDFVVYQGANSFAPVPLDSKLGVAGSVVAHLAQTLPVGSQIYCDRYFTSLSLAEYMLSKDIYITGTVQKCRVPKDAMKLSDDKLLMAKGRGSSTCVVNDKNTAAVVTWCDNKPIKMMSTVHGILPEDKCRRWSKKDKNYIEVQRPFVIQQYNLLMGGVDMCDRMISYYRMDARTCKWTIRTIFHFFDLAIVNAWIGYREDEIANGTPRKKIMQLMDFRITVAETYMAATEPDETSDDRDESEEEGGSRSTRRRSVVPAPAASFRIASARHLPEMAASAHSMRCRNDGCSGKTKVRCISCRVFLCMTAERNCFKNYHVAH